jgi:hypothetical protein
MTKVVRSRLPLVAAAALAFVALAAFLVLDLAGPSVDASSLPVIQIEPASGSVPGHVPGQWRQGNQGGGPGGASTTETGGLSGAGAEDPQGMQSTASTTTITVPGLTTGSTIRETIMGGVRTGTTTMGGGGTGTTTMGGGGTGGGAGGGGPDGTSSTETTGRR